MVNQALLQEVYQWIDYKRENILAELADLIAIPSVSDASSDVKPFGQGLRDVMDCMLRKGEREGFSVHNYDNYVGSVLYDVGADPKDTIGIWAHLDVVPEGDNWQTDPYQMVVKDGFMFGRGVSDNKNAAIGSFYIQQALRACKVPLKHNIQLFLGTSEETGMDDVKYYVQHYPTPKFSLVPDYGFPGTCGEFGRIEFDLVSKNSLSENILEFYAGSVFNIIPNKATIVMKKTDDLDLSVIPEEGYSVTQDENTVTIEASGLSSHAAAPQRGVNAIHQLTKVLCELPGVSENDRMIFRFLTDVNSDCYGTWLGFAKSDEVSGETVSSGTILRMSDGIVTMTNDCRHCVTDTNENIISAIEKKCGENDFELKVKQANQPYHIDPNSEVIQMLTKLYHEFTGETDGFTISKGGTYAGKVPMAVATGICFYGAYPRAELPAGHGGAHQPDEHLNIDGYIAGIKMLISYILHLDEIL